ncbi:MAG: ATP-binding cassette domain-containing protein [Gemmataceae bacterium]|nr:ATP-binding cassette domain-containing protein [Gemmataceae bacterium]
MTLAVELSGVTKTFGPTLAVDDLHLQVPRDCVYGFIGPNGSGKTTTLRMILRIFHPDRGRVSVFGAEHGTAADDRLGYLPEERGLYKKMKVADLLRFYAALKGMTDSKAAINNWLERLGLAGRAGDRVETLSKGMSQKVQFIAAVVSKPELLILDEPFSGLDPVNRDAIKDAILDVRKQGTTIIFSTHDMKVAEQMCDTIFMIYRGRKVLDGTLDAIQAEYGEDTVRVRTPLDSAGIARLPGVVNVNDFGREKELRLTRGADPQATLRGLLSQATVEHFEIVRPSLHDIFVRIAGPSAKEHDHA